MATKKEVVEQMDNKITAIKPDEKLSSYQILSRIDVSPFVEKKNGLSYVSWAWATHKLLELFPDAELEVVRYDNNPYYQTERGFFVETRVTLNCPKLTKPIVRTCILPVLDYKNKPIATPTPFDVNTSIQRCMTKCIALHGLGLSVYAGEDLPLEEVEEKNAPIVVKAKFITKEQVKEIESLWVKFHAIEKLSAYTHKTYGQPLLKNITTEQADEFLIFLKEQLKKIEKQN